MGFALIEAQVSLMFVITDEAIKRKLAKLIDAQAQFKEHRDHTQDRRRQDVQMLNDN